MQKHIYKIIIFGESPQHLGCIRKFDIDASTWCIPERAKALFDQAYAAWL